MGDPALNIIHDVFHPNTALNKKVKIDIFIATNNSSNPSDSSNKASLTDIYNSGENVFNSGELVHNKRAAHYEYANSIISNSDNSGGQGLFHSWYNSNNLSKDDLWYFQQNGQKGLFRGGPDGGVASHIPNGAYFIIHVKAVVDDVTRFTNDVDSEGYIKGSMIFQKSTGEVFYGVGGNDTWAGTVSGLGAIGIENSNNRLGGHSWLYSEIAVGGGGGGSVGDPYVQPMFGPTIKLPNIEAKYCLYHDQDLTITGSTKNISKEHQQKIVEYSEQFPTSFHNVLGKKLITEGILYDKFYIATNNEYVLIDVEKRTITTSKDCTKTFTMKMEEDRCNMDIFEEMACKSLNIRFKTPNHGNVRVAIQFFENPQIDNGIYLHMDRNVAQGTGLLVRNYKPKLLQINNLTTVPAKMEKRLKKTKYPFTQRGILSKGEMWNTVNNKQTKITLH